MEIGRPAIYMHDMLQASASASALLQVLTYLILLLDFQQIPTPRHTTPLPFAVVNH